MTKDEARIFLTHDGGTVPCSRYGRNSEDCWPYAWAVAEIFADANGDEITEDLLDHLMGLVVNDHQDIEDLIREHGSPEAQALLLVRTALRRHEQSCRLGAVRPNPTHPQEGTQ